MEIVYTTCVICDTRTVNQCFNERDDSGAYVCEAHERQFYRETCLPKASDCEDCKLKETGE